MQGYVKSILLTAMASFLRIDFLSWYEDGMDKGKQIVEIMDQQITEKFSNGSGSSRGSDNDQSCYAAFEKQW